MSKTESGYAIRTQMLHLAQSIVDRNTEWRREASRGRYEDAAVSIGVSGDHTYTTEDVIREAEKLYAFVQRKD